MGLKNKEPKQAKTVVIQPIMKEEKSTGATTTPTTPAAPKLNRRGEPYINGKEVAAYLVSALPVICCTANAVNDVADAKHKIKKENLKGKEKAKVIAKTTGKFAAKYTAGIIGSYCSLRAIDDTFDLS